MYTAVLHYLISQSAGHSSSDSSLDEDSPPPVDPCDACTLQSLALLVETGALVSLPTSGAAETEESIGACALESVWTMSASAE